MHAHGTAEVIQQHLDDPLALALAQDAMTETRLTPWYRDTVAGDRQRAAQITATLQGRKVPRPTDPQDALLVAMLYDADLFRAFIETRSLLALPQEVMARPGMLDHIMAVAGAHEAATPPGPSREELLRLLAQPAVARPDAPDGRSARG